MINHKPLEFEDVIVYDGNQDDPPLNAIVRNLNFDTNNAERPQIGIKGSFHTCFMRIQSRFNEMILISYLFFKMLSF